jgi:hypothetical protein
VIVFITLTRWAAIAVLLWVVWHHAHWSVALTVSLLVIATEAQSSLWRRLAK